MKKGYIYIMTNKNHTVFYTGVTSILPKEFMNIKWMRALDSPKNITLISWFALMIIQLYEM